MFTFVSQKPAPSLHKPTWRVMLVMVKLGKCLRYPGSILDFSNSHRGISEFRNGGYDAAIFENFENSDFYSKADMHSYICFDPSRCVPIYLLQFDQFVL